VVSEAERHGQQDPEGEAAFDAYVEALGEVIGHADRPSR
jgi:hypothetical protein